MPFFSRVFLTAIFIYLISKARAVNVTVATTEGTVHGVRVCTLAFSAPPPSFSFSLFLALYKQFLRNSLIFNSQRLRQSFLSSSPLYSPHLSHSFVFVEFRSSHFLLLFRFWALQKGSAPLRRSHFVLNSFLLPTRPFLVPALCNVFDSCINKTFLRNHWMT